MSTPVRASSPLEYAPPLPLRASRSIATTFWLPPGDGPHPLLLYFPGWDAGPIDNRVLSGKLAELGFVVCAISYRRGAADRDLEFDSPIDLSSAAAVERTSRLAELKVRHRAADAVAVLDWISAARGYDRAPVFRLIDDRRVGAIGFSLGGAVAAETCIGDPRVRAAVNLDGWHFSEALERGVAKPYLLITDDGARLTALRFRLGAASHGARFSECNVRRALDNIAHHGGHVLTIRRSRHQDFTDASDGMRGLLSRALRGVSREHVRRIVWDQAGGFFLRHLLGQTATWPPPSGASQEAFMLRSFQPVEPYQAKAQLSGEAA